LPELRRFIKDKGNADMYIGLKLSYILHHPPRLYLFGDDGAVTQEIDLEQYNFDGLRDLLESHNFKRKMFV